MLNNALFLDRIATEIRTFNSRGQSSVLDPFMIAYYHPYADGSVTNDYPYFFGEDGSYSEFEPAENIYPSFVVNAELPILDGHRGSVQLTTGPFYGLVQYYESYGQKYPPYLGMRVSPNDQGTFSKNTGGDFVCIGWHEVGHLGDYSKERRVATIERARNDANFLLVKPDKAIDGRIGMKAGWGYAKIVYVVQDAYAGYSSRDNFQETEESVIVFNWTKNSVGETEGNYLVCARFGGDNWYVIAEDCYRDVSGSEDPDPPYGGILGAPIRSSRINVSENISDDLKQDYTTNRNRLNSQSLTGSYSQIAEKIEGVERSSEPSIERKKIAKRQSQRPDSFFVNELNLVTPSVGRRFTYTPPMRTRLGKKQGPFNFQISTRLPDGLSFNRNTGTVRGTLVKEMFNVTILMTATDASNRTDSTKIIINTKVDGLRVTPPTNLSLTVGASATKTWTATGGVEPYTFSIDNTPAGMTFNTRTGVLSGTPSGAGTTSCTVTVTDVSSYLPLSGAQVSSDAVNLVAIA